MKSEGNLTGGQIQDVWDRLIYAALEPIVLHCNVFDVQIVHLLGRATVNKKRKLSALEREDFISNLCRALIADAPTKYSILCLSKIERGFICRFIQNFLEVCADYEVLYQEWLLCPSSAADKKLLMFEESMGTTREKLWPTIATSRIFLDKSFEFRNGIVEAYMRHASKQASAFCAEKKKGEQFDVSDVGQNLMAAVIRGLEKYDSSQGAVTSYVNFWLLNATTYASTDHGHEYGIAYIIPQTAKRAMANADSSKHSSVNFSVSLNQIISTGDEDATLEDMLDSGISVEGEIVDRQEQEIILKLCKIADRHGLARLYMGIGETFTVKEIQQQNEAMRLQGITK